MKVLIACEESQRVCIAFRKLGHEAYSCDIQEPSGGHPEWHILGDALEAIKGGVITTADGKTQIGACRIPGRKKICLCIDSGTCLTVYGYFQSEQKADEFMQKLGRLVGAREEGEENAPD